MHEASASLQYLVALLDEQFDDDRLRGIPLDKRARTTELIEGLFDRLIEHYQPTAFIEVGAYEAGFSRRMRERYPEAAVYAFEANPRVFYTFCKDIQATGVDYRHLAIGAKAGTTQIHIPEVIADNAMPYAGRMASLNVVALRNSQTTAVEVPMLTLDEAVGALSSGNLALWIDVEGAVDQVLAGAHATLARAALVICELERSPVWIGQVLAGTIRNSFADQGLTMVARDSQKWFQYNAIFVRAPLLDDDPGARALIEEFVQSALTAWDEVTPPRLFQYWDREERPKEVAELMAGWQSDHSFRYRAYTRKTAEKFIGEHLGERFLAAFGACRVPAMQADFFRLCALYVCGGIYLDADIQNLGTNELLLRREGRGLLLRRRGSVANDLIVVHKRRDPLMKYALDAAVDAIDQRMPGSVWAVTGPGILSGALQRLGPDDEIFRGFRFLPVEQVREVIGFRWNLEYKASDAHWTSVAADNLYFDQPAETD